MKLILHIGTEKTGTTAIQKYLEPRDNLAGLNLWTPRSQGLGNHSYFAAYALDTHSRDIALTMRKLEGNAQKHAEFRQMIERSLIKDIAASKVDDFVVTSEDLSRLFKPHQIARLADIFKGLFEEVQIILFVRRQDEIAISRHGMFVRDGIGARFSFDEIEDFTRRNFYDYAAIFSRWEEQFPRAQITVVPYGKSSRNSGRDSIDLFLEAIGRSPEFYKKTLRANKSLSQARYRFFQIMRHRYRSKLSYKTALPLIEALPLGELDETLPASADSASKFLHFFAGSNLSLGAKLGEGHLFTDDTSIYPDNFSWEEFDKEILAQAPDEIIAQFV